ncbi:MAG: V-type ATPase subunit [Candidatus Diapherotrites archaeon]|nr:V-type ATPase subunit [Candidatus Diapherotrites archaeon]
MSFESVLPIAQAFGFEDPVVFLALLIVFSLVLLLAIFVPIIWYIIGIAKYVYPNARANAMSGKLLSKTQYSEMLSTRDASEVLSILERTEYEPYIVKTERIDIGLKKALLDTYKRILSMAPDDVEKPLSLYLKEFWFVSNLKEILRAKHAGKEPTYVPWDETDRILQDYASSSDTDELLSKLQDSEFSSVIAKALPEYKRTKNVGYIENALDRWVLETTVGYARLPVFRQYLEKLIDVYNIMTLLRLKKIGAQTDIVRGMLIPIGRLYKKLYAIADAENPDAVVLSLEDTEYGEILTSVRQEAEKTHSLRPYERALNKEVLRFIKSIALGNMLNAGPLLSYIHSKTVEVANIRAIIHMKAGGFSEKEIEEVINI